MSAFATTFAIAFTSLFVVVEPFGVVPIFASLTRGRSAAGIRAVALRASLVGAAVLILFTFGGRLLLDTLGVRVDSFRMAGGLLLLLAALEMLRGKIASCRCTPAELEDAGDRSDIAIVPIAIPLLAGPGAMATVMMLVSREPGIAGTGAVLGAIELTFVISYVVLRFAAVLQAVLGRSIMAVVERILGLVLAALSIQFIVEGGINLLRTVGGAN